MLHKYRTKVAHEALGMLEGGLSDRSTGHTMYRLQVVSTLFRKFRHLNFMTG